MTSINETERVRAVLAQHKDAIMKEPNATGVGIGKGADGKPAIVVYLKAPPAAPGPASLDGVPVQYVVTGAIKPLN
jgi:hypothetical protein